MFRLLVLFVVAFLPLWIAVCLECSGVETLKLLPCEGSLEECHAARCVSPLYFALMMWTTIGLGDMSGIDIWWALSYVCAMIVWTSLWLWMARLGCGLYFRCSDPVTCAKLPWRSDLPARALFFRYLTWNNIPRTYIANQHDDAIILIAV
jgi:hypothetical protein